MEPLWSPAVANGGNRRQIEESRKRQQQAKTVAVGCDPLPETFHGKQGVCRGPPPVAKVPSLRRRGSTRGPLSAGFRRALTQATHYSTIMHDLLFARASTSRASLTEQAVRRPPHDQHDQQADVLASPRLMNGARRPGEKTLARSSHLSRARVALSHEVPRRSTPHHRRQ